MNGFISVKSEKGKGSTFSFSVDLQDVCIQETFMNSCDVLHFESRNYSKYLKFGALQPEQEMISVYSSRSESSSNNSVQLLSRGLSSDPQLKMLDFNKTL